MCRILPQQVVLSVLFCKMALNARSHLIKRSPLELGFVTFPETEKPKRLILFNKTNTEMNLESDEVGLSVPINRSGRGRIFHQEWIPGKIRHHSYIPAHIHHIYLPIVIAKTVLVKSPYDYYSRPYGGFGVGSFVGGQGAGHGFHIVFNN